MIRRNDILRSVRQRISDLDLSAFGLNDMEVYLRDAVREYSRWRTKMATETITVVAGEDVYDADPDAEDLIAWTLSWTNPETLIVGDVELIYSEDKGEPQYLITPVPTADGYLSTTYKKAHTMVRGDFPTIPSHDHEILVNLMLWKLYETIAAELAKQGRNQVADTSRDLTPSVNDYLRLAQEAKADALNSLDEPVVNMGWMWR